MFTALVKFEHMERSKNGLPAENTVFYRLYPAETSEADAVQADNLTYLAVKCTELAKELTEDHVWHYESFRLGVCPSHAQGTRGMCLFISPNKPRDLSEYSLLPNWQYFPPTQTQQHMLSYRPTLFMTQLKCLLIQGLLHILPTCVGVCVIVTMWRMSGC